MSFGPFGLLERLLPFALSELPKIVSDLGKH